MRNVSVQFQPDRVIADEACVRQSLREALGGAEVRIDKAGARYENFAFETASPEDALSKVRPVFDSTEVGRAARASCIVTCQGERGWDDYLLLHHYDPAVKVDDPATRPAD